MGKTSISSSFNEKLPAEKPVRNSANRDCKQLYDKKKVFKRFRTASSKKFISYHTLYAYKPENPLNPLATVLKTQRKEASSDAITVIKKLDNGRTSRKTEMLVEYLACSSDYVKYQSYYNKFGPDMHVLRHNFMNFFQNQRCCQMITSAIHLFPRKNAKKSYLHLIKY